MGSKPFLQIIAEVATTTSNLINLDKIPETAHVNCVCKRTSSALGVLQPHCTHLPIQCKLLFYQCYILPIFDYCDTAWCGLSDTTLNQLEVHHRFILKILYNKDRCFPSDALCRLAHTSPLSVRHKHHLCTLVHKIFLHKTPSHMMKYNWFSTSSTRNALILPLVKSAQYLKSPLFSGYSHWLSLPYGLKTCSSIGQFKDLLSQLN